MKPEVHSKSWLMPTVVAVVAAVAAGYAFHLNWIDVRNRWTRFDTDTNSHAYVMLGLAQNAWKLDLIGWYKDFDGPRTWPPLHGFLGSFVQLAAGKPDIRLAIIPSLFGWWLTAVCAALAARRMTPVGGNAAGFFAAIFVLASPSHRIFAADVMLESLGAGLTMLAAWTYLRARQIGGAREWTWFGVSLSLLLVEKYNYWVLIAIPILGWEILLQMLAWWKTPGAFRTVGGVLKNEARNPLSAAALLVGIVAFGGFALSRLQIPVFGKAFRVDAFINVFEAFAILIVFRVIQWRRASGPEWLSPLGDRWKGLFVGHALPAFVWFCLPKRFGSVVEYLTRRQSSTQDPNGWRSGMEFFAGAAGEYYAVHWLLAVLTAFMVALALLQIRRMNAGAAVVFLTLAFCVFATAAQPTRGSRFMHSWAALLWVVGGAGFAASVASIRPVVARRTIVVGALATLAAFQAPSLLDRGKSSEPHHERSPSTLAAADAFLESLTDARRVSFVSNVQISDFARWTYTERFPDRPRIECFIRRFSPDREKNAKLLEQWTADAGLDAIVSIDVDEKSPQYFPGWESFEQFREHLEAQSAFVKSIERSFPELGCTVTVWRPSLQTARAASTTTR